MTLQLSMTAGLEIELGLDIAKVLAGKRIFPELTNEVIPNFCLCLQLVESARTAGDAIGRQDRQGTCRHYRRHKCGYRQQHNDAPHLFSPPFSLTCCLRLASKVSINGVGGNTPNGVFFSHGWKAPNKV